MGFLRFLPLALFAGASTLHAATITVNTTVDQDGTGATACALREAIVAARDNVAYGGCIAGTASDTIVLSAGTYNLLQPDLSAELRARKVATLTDTAPEAIAAGNVGCLMQIGAGTALPVVHTVELLDWATGGPRPAALGG